MKDVIHLGKARVHVCTEGTTSALIKVCLGKTEVKIDPREGESISQTFTDS